jgi:spore maturation protein CgeB
MSDERIYQPYISGKESLNAVLSATDLPLSNARNELPTLSHLGVRFHSNVDPMREADQLLSIYQKEIADLRTLPENKSATVYILGPGLGYLISALDHMVTSMSLNPARFRIICVEADPNMAKTALQHRVWEPGLVSVRWVVGSAANSELYSENTPSEKIIIKNTAGYRLNRGYYDDAILSLQDEIRAERPMRILVPTPLYGGSLPAAVHSANAFEKMGHVVERLDLTSYYQHFNSVNDITRQIGHRKSLQGMLTSYLAEVIAARALDFKADLVWAVAQTPLTPQALDELRHHGVHTALWFVEDYQLFGYWREVASHYDAVFTIQKSGFHEELRASGVRFVDYLPCAADPDVHHPSSLTAAEQARYGSDVSFVGAGYYNRQIVMASPALPNLKIWGNDWPENCPAQARIQENGRRVETDETVKIFAASKINLNLHSSSNHLGVNPYGDFVNPRTFEIAACGAFQLVDARSELTGLFEAGSELAVFKSVDELPELIDYYLAHEQKRQEMASKARDRVLREHTYVHRMQHAVAALEQKFPRLRDRKRGPNYVSSLVQAAGDDRELVDFLASFDQNEELDLEKIVSHIKLGQGKLTRPEGIFLLMKEFRDWGVEKGVIS